MEKENQINEITGDTLDEYLDNLVSTYGIRGGFSPVARLEDVPYVESYLP